MYSKYQKGLDIIVKELDSCGEEFWEEREKELIKQYGAGGRLRNIDEGGRGVITLEKRNKSSLQRSAEGHYKKIVLFNKAGKLIEICDSCKEAIEKYGLNKTSIGNVLSGRSKTCNGYYIVTFDQYKSKDFSILEYIQSLTDKTVKRKLVYQYSLEGSLIKIYNGVSEASNDLKCDRGGITRALKNKKIFRNCYWAHTNTINIQEFEKYYKYEYQGHLFRTYREIAEFVNLKDCTISNHVRNNEPVKGYFINPL